MKQRRGFGPASSPLAFYLDLTMTAPALFDLPAPLPKRREPHQNGRDTSDVWLTPVAVLDQLGPFDLDPCAPAIQPWPTAARRYTEADDGLAQDWEGRVWLNPPYSRPLYSLFMARMAAHGWGTALVFARTETADFFRHVWESATGALFLEGRLFFHHEDGRRAKANAGAPSVLVAYGQEDADRLAASGLAGAFVPLRLPRSYAAVAVAGITWDQLLRETMARQGGPVTISDLYRSLARHPKARGRQHWRAKVRQTLQRGDFTRLERGVWAA